MHVILNERDENFNTKYDLKTHYNIDYIRFAIYAL